MKIILIGDIFPTDEFLSLRFGIKSQFEKIRERSGKTISLILQKIRIL